MSRLFNGTSDLISIGLGTWGYLPFTWAGWVNAAAPSASVTCVSQSRPPLTANSVLFIGSSSSTPFNKTRLFLKDDSGATALDVSGTAVSFDGTWHHICVTLDGTPRYAIYVDGVLDTSGTTTAATITCGSSTFGALVRTSTTGFLSGKLAHWARWNRAISAGEAAALFAGTSPLDLGALYYWPLLGNRLVAEPDFGYEGDAAGSLTGTSVSADNPPRARSLPRGWVVQHSAVIRGVIGVTSVSDADSATLTEGSPSIAATVSDSDSATETEGTPKVALTSADGASLSSETSSVTALTDHVVSASDSATLTDAIAVQNIGDFDTFHLAETAAVATLTDTVVASSDSATLSSTATVSTLGAPSDSDSATVSETSTVTAAAPVDLNDRDASSLSEGWIVIVAVSSSDGATLAQNDGGSPGGGTPPPTDGGGTGSGGGPGIVTTLARRHIHAVV